MSESHTANRDYWTFSYTADKLATAAKERLDWYQKRLTWWQAKKIEVVKKIREEGLEIDESLAMESKWAASNSGYRDTTVSVRNDLMADLRECIERVRRHNDNVKTYDGWLQVLTAQGTTSLSLTQQDWLFFFSVPKATEDSEDR
jgi:hypothetical protein